MEVGQVTTAVAGGQRTAWRCPVCEGAMGFVAKTDALCPHCDAAPWLIYAKPGDGLLQVAFIKTSLDGPGIDDLPGQLYPLTQTTHCVALDMTRVTFLASMALGILITLQANLSRRGGTLQLGGVSPFIRAILDLYHVECVFDMPSVASRTG